MTRATRPVLTAVAALVAIVPAAGCTSSHASAHHTASVSAGPSLPAGVVGLAKLPTSVPNKPASRANVAMSGCAATRDGWAAAGTAHNPAEQATTYTITVFFTTNHATVIGAATTKVRVAAGASRSWSANATFHPATPTLCVLRGVG